VNIRRLLLTAATITFAMSGASPGNEDARFETKLSPDQRIRHALNRLTFGARPGDFDEVRKIGVEKWIELQLHPERISENEVLDSRLKPLETLRMEVAEIIKQYFPRNPPGMMPFVNPRELLGQEQYRRIYNGTAEQRRAAIEALDSFKRVKVLAVLPPSVLEDLPDLRKEQELARRKDQEDRQIEMRRIRPPLSDLLDPEAVAIARNGPEAARQVLFDTLDETKLQQVAANLPPAALGGRPGLRRMVEMSRLPNQVVLGDLREAKLYRAVYSNHQLEEVLADFWFNHFNVFEGKGQQTRALLASYERDPIRPHVLGKFKDLLLATARHPAMLYYLDNWESMGGTDFNQIGPFASGPFGGQPFPNRQAHGLNENYGRELMELHTLGVNGGYTQQDVINVARCFTGWSIRLPNQKPEFAYAAFMHDTDEKTVLGHKIPAGGGEQDGLTVIDILAHHPSTARYISTKLAKRFVADEPPAALIDRMAKVFLKTDGDLRAVLETMFTSREFFSEGAWEAKIKSPLEMVASAVRAIDGVTTDSFTLAQKVADMGEPLYAKEAPTGYKDNQESWLSTAAVMARIDLAKSLVSGDVPGVRVNLSRWDGKDAAVIARDLLNRDASEQTLAAIQDGLQGRPAEPKLIASLVLSSPEFQRR